MQRCCPLPPVPFPCCFWYVFTLFLFFLLVIGPYFPETSHSQNTSLKNSLGVGIVSVSNDLSAIFVTTVVGVTGHNQAQCGGQAEYIYWEECFMMRWSCDGSL